MRGSFVRSTPLRIAIILGAAFAVAMLLAGIVAWQLIDRELAGRLDESIREEFAVISQTYGSGDITDLRDSVASHVTATIGDSRVYLLRGPGNTVLAGNITQAKVALGWSLAPASALGLAGNGRYRVFSSAVGGNPLLVGASLTETEAVGRIVMTSLAVAAVLLAAILVGIGTILTIRSQQRLSRIREVMQQVGQGQLKARLPISRRLDDIDAVARQVNEALDRLAAVVESMRQVSVDIAHDLKTPLNRLSIAVASAAAVADEGSEIEQQLDEAEQEIELMNATFDALLRIAQIETGSRRSRFLPISVASLLSRLADLYTDVAEEHGQSFVVEIGDPLDPVRGDRELLTQLFVNLIENAIRYGGRSAYIGIVARNTDTGVAVEVSDTGPGIPEAEREAVFRRLYRMERSRTSPGSGLGLSLVKAIAELHEATITLSDNAPGLKVTVKFPTADDGVTGLDGHGGGHRS